MDTKEKQITSVTHDWIMDCIVTTYDDGSYEEKYASGRVIAGIRHNKCLDHDEPLTNLGE